MYKDNAATLKDFLGSREDSSLRFEDILKSKQSKTLLEDLIFLSGYNFIICNLSATGELCFEAGMSPEDTDEKFTINNNTISGKLANHIHMVFEVAKKLAIQPQAFEYYPQEIKRKYYDEIILNNKISSFTLYQLELRISR
ncbi:hypothetical protein ACFQW4_02610 [Pantoea sp. GCM10028869]|uniref:hypothetical protein n=1 Tax=Pantoea sp. GCM10028869 TaxID=3273417 RepID=UPI003619C3FC